MKKSFMNNIKNFVDSNVRQRIDRAANNNNDFFGDDLLIVERQFEDIRLVCVEAEKRISALLQSLGSSPISAYTQNVQASLNSLSSLTTTNSPINNPAGSINPSEQQATTSSLACQSKATPATATRSKSQQSTSHHESSTLSNNNEVASELHGDIRRHKKLPVIGFLKFLTKSCYKLKPDSLLGATLTHCSQLQTQLTKLYLEYEQTIEVQCLKPIQFIIEVDIPNVIKLRKLFIKSHNDLESVKGKYNGASQKQQQFQTSHFTSTSYTITQSSAQQANINKLDQLKKELEDAIARFSQAKDSYATELYSFVCREAELVNLFMRFYQLQAEYQYQVSNSIQNSLPTLNNILASTPRKVVFGIPLEEHLRCTGRSVSLVIELCVHLLHSYALNEEGLFRIPGSTLKIKKLKNAINAWFVTLASQGELEIESQQHHSLGAQTSVGAVYNLFKGIVAQRPQQAALIGCDTIGNPSTTVRDDSTLTQTNSSSSQDGKQLVFDTHTIAGLLKLYLRELPEPLFTYTLYDQWIEATVKTMNNEEPFALERVIAQLPKANHCNLKHLIRFLHLLTCHRDLNKMTATNLAITMAPSLIWAKPTIIHQQSSELSGNNGGSIVEDDMQALNNQMSSIGVSASLHARVIENLINNAEKLLPGPVHFAIPGLNDLPTNSRVRGSQPPRHERGVNSTSPTGLSTASSSSFSSASNTSVASSTSKTHARKGGSMEGLLGNGGSISFENSRPISVNYHREIQPHRPPVPPAPAIRSHARQGSDSFCTTRSSSTYKNPAPPIPSEVPIARPIDQPSGSSQIRQPEIGKSEERSNRTDSSCADYPTTSCKSLRGTGTVPANGLSASRPTVPPPLRPSSRPPGTHVGCIDQVDIVQRARLKEGDNKSSQSLASSGNLRADFEEIDGVNVDDVDISDASDSPEVSLNSISASDSSFDHDDSHSLEHSWTECDLNSIKQSSSEKLNVEQEIPGPDDYRNDQQGPKLEQQPRQSNLEDSAITNKEANKDGLAPIPPVKPPRSISPKITQSTPL